MGQILAATKASGLAAYTHESGPHAKQYSECLVVYETPLSRIAHKTLGRKMRRANTPQ